MNFKTASALANPKLRFARICAVCSMFGVLGTMALLLALSLVSYLKIDNPDRYYSAFSISAASISAIFTGYNACRLYNSRGLFCGLTCGGMMSAVLMAVSALLPASEDASFPIAIICTVIFNCAGAMVRSNAKKRADPLNIKLPSAMRVKKKAKAS